MRIPLTAAQAVMAHGWLRAREYLTWGDVLTTDRLTFAYMLQDMQLSDYTLHSLQPDLHAWIRNNKVSLEQCPLLQAQWGAHPIEDFKADLADLIRMRWQVELYKKMGVTFEDLLKLGLTPETMMLFGFTLMNWIQLGLSKEYCEQVHEVILYKLFGMSKMQVLSCLQYKNSDTFVSPTKTAS
jgi:hypothetical protein